MFFTYALKLFAWMPPILQIFAGAVVTIFVVSLLLRLVKLIMDIIPVL